MRLERDLARLDADLARQTDLVSKGVILAEDYVPARERLPAEREAIVQRLEDLLEGVEEPEKRALAPARTSQRAQDLDLTPSRLTGAINPKSHRRHPRRRRPPRCRNASSHRLPARLPPRRVFVNRPPIMRFIRGNF